MTKIANRPSETSLMSTYSRSDLAFVRGEGVWLFDKKGNLISTFIGKQDEIKIRESINNLEKEENPYEEIINAEFSIIQKNKKNEVNPRSHG